MGIRWMGARLEFIPVIHLFPCDPYAFDVIPRRRPGDPLWQLRLWMPRSSPGMAVGGKLRTHLPRCMGDLALAMLKVLPPALPGGIANSGDSPDSPHIIIFYLESYLLEM